jgi:hypothetical protein
MGYEASGIFHEGESHDRHGHICEGTAGILVLLGGCLDGKLVVMHVESRNEAV